MRAVHNRSNHSHPHRWLPWSGLAAGAVAWIVQHQAGTYIAASCLSNAGQIIKLLGIACMIVALLGGALSARELFARADNLDSRHEGTHRFIAAIGVLSAVLFMLALALQTAGPLIVPVCVR